MIQKYFPFLLLSFFFVSCASVPKYSYDFLLSSEKIISIDKTLQARTPSGWFVPADTSLSRKFLFLLISERYTSTISLQEIKVDRATESRINDEGLRFLTEISLAFKKASAPSYFFSTKAQIFSIDNQEYCGYEYYDDKLSNRTRVVVFRINKKFFECSATPISGPWYETDLKKLYTAMHAFLKSLQVVNPTI